MKARHSQWLAPKPQGFIPELTDVAMLRTIEQRLDGRLAPERRKLLEALRDKALAGRLTKSEFDAAMREGRRTSPLRAFATSFRSILRRARRLDDMPPELVRDLAALGDRIDALARSRAVFATITPAVRAELAALGVRSFVNSRA